MKNEPPTHVLGLAHPPIPVVRIGLIGLGNRGLLTLERYMLIEHVEIKALCEIGPGNLAKGQTVLAKGGHPAATGYAGENGIGPVCQILNIHRDDRLNYLVSMSTHQAGMTEYARRTFGKDSLEAQQAYLLGDMNTPSSIPSRERPSNCNTAPSIRALTAVRTLSAAREDLHRNTQ